MFKQRLYRRILTNALFLAPITIVIVAVIVFPLVYAFGLSVSYWNLVSGVRRNISLNDWSDLLYLGDKASLKEALFLSGRVKEAIFSEGGT
jgi:ABC-type sugar transport system permease subunit